MQETASGLGMNGTRGVCEKAGHLLPSWEAHQGKGWRVGMKENIRGKAFYALAQVFCTPELPNRTLLDTYLYPHFLDENVEVQRDGKAPIITQPA